MSELSEVWGRKIPGGEEAVARDAGFVWTTLPRHGRRPALFLGRALIRADDRASAPAGHTASIWSNVEIYEIYAGGYVTSIRHYRRAEDRACYQNAWLAEDGADVIAALRTHDIDSVAPNVPVAADPAPSCSQWNALVGAIFGSEVRL
jgi:hypothetical protein